MGVRPFGSSRIVELLPPSASVVLKRAARAMVRTAKIAATVTSATSSDEDERLASPNIQSWKNESRELTLGFMSDTNELRRTLSQLQVALVRKNVLG